jgi:hypothetical protein
MKSGSLTAVLLAAALLLSACGSSNSSSSTTASSTSSAATGATTAAPAHGAIGPEGIPLETGAPLGPASSTLPGTTVDGIQCAPIEQLAYHIHAHLQVYVNGQSRQLPPAIGLLGPVSQQTAQGPFFGAQKCYYWLHTHAGDGIIHIESPTKRIYTLGDFFDEWHQPLSSTQVATASGKVTAFVNGKPWTQDIRSIPLNPHAEVQLDVGGPVVGFAPISFSGTSL